MPLLPGPAIFDQSLAAHRALRAVSVSISLDATLNGVVTTGRYHLDYQAPNKALLVKFLNGQKNMVFWLNGSKFLAVDVPAHEMAVRKAPSSGPIVNRLANALGGLEDPIAAQLSPTTLAGFYAPFKNLGDWHVETSQGRIVLTRRTTQNGKASMTEFVFNASSKLLTKALLVGPTSKLQWLFAYDRPPKTLAFTPPAGTRLVPSLAEHANIDSSDPKASSVVDLSLRTYSRLTSLAFSVTSAEGASQDWMSGRSFRERNRKVDWAYTGGVLTLKDLAHGKAYRGKCSPLTVLSYLKALQTRMDPVLQAYLTHTNPISGWFAPGMKVTSKGSVTIGRVTADAIEMRTEDIEIDMLIRRDNHLVASVTSRIRRNGAVVSEVSREFSYASVNKALPAADFSLSVKNPLPLAHIGK